MRIMAVVGKVSLVREHPSLTGKKYVLAAPFDLEALASGGDPAGEELVVIDELGAGPGDRIGVSEGMEATFPFHPEKKPVDCYNACILDAIDLDAAALSSVQGRSPRGRGRKG